MLTRSKKTKVFLFGLALLALEAGALLWWQGRGAAQTDDGEVQAQATLADEIAKAKVWEELGQVQDPEFQGGLLLDYIKEPAVTVLNGQATIALPLPQWCPFRANIFAAVEERIEQVPGIYGVTVTFAQETPSEDAPNDANGTPSDANAGGQAGEEESENSSWLEAAGSWLAGAAKTVSDWFFSPEPAPEGVEPTAPEILDAGVSPDKVIPGDTMRVTATVRDAHGIALVLADMGGIETIRLENVGGDVFAGDWAGDWLVHSTELQGYVTTITATNIYGLSASTTVHWTDPASWWDANYSYRKQLRVTNNTASTLSAGYTAYATVNMSALTAAGKLQADGDDLRIVYWNGTANSELDRHLRYVGSTSAEVYWKTQADIAASASSTSYFLYYGHSAAASPPADGRNVYEYFTDFATSTGWSTITGSPTYNGSAVLASGASIQYNSGVSGTAYNKIFEQSVKIDLASARSTWWGAALRQLSSGYYCGRECCTGAYEGYKDHMFFSSANGGADTSSLTAMTHNGGTGSYTQSSTFSPGSGFSIYTEKWKNGQVNYSFNGSPVATHTVAVSSSYTAYYVIWNLADSGNDLEVDWYLQRRYVSPEPSTTLLTEEAAGPSNLNQSGYRWFNNANGLDVGSARAAANTATLTPALGTPFRLRLLIHAGEAVATNTAFRLQVAQRGSDNACDSAFTGETYADVATSSGAIRYYNNAAPADGAALTANAGDPGHLGHTVVRQSYEEANNFAAATSVPAGADGLWDFSLVNYSAATGTAWCFRAVGAVTGVFNAYSQIPMITTADVTVQAPAAPSGTVQYPAAGLYLGGQIAVVENVASRTLLSVTLTEGGTVNGQTGLANLKLFYENDTTAPYNCLSESFDGTEAQFGSTDADGFSGANGTSTFTGSVPVSTTSAACLYPVLDVTNFANDGETVVLKINDPSEDITMSGTIIGPGEPLILGTTTLSVTVKEFVAIVDPGSGTGADFSSLFAWEAAVQSNLATATTKVFSYATTTDNLPALAYVKGETSGATGTLVWRTASSTVRLSDGTYGSSQVLLKSISGVFQPGEKVYNVNNSAQYVHITDAGSPAIATAKCRTTSGAADTTAVEIDGWTTATTTYIKIWTDPDDPWGRHKGIWDEGKYRLELTAEYGFALSEEHVWVDGLQVKVARASGNGNGITLNPSATPARYLVSNNIVRGVFTDMGSDYSVGIYGNWYGSGSGRNAYIWNNIVYDFDDGLNAYGVGIWIRNGWMSYVYNNTVYNNYRGIYTPSWTILAKNNLSYDNQINYTTGFVTGSANNLSGPTLSDAPGVNPQNAKTVRFLNAAAGDFHLHPDDTSARDAGTSSPLWDQNLSFYSDIDGTARGAAWDIGADELPVDFTSVICQTAASGGDCANLDYSSLSRWEDKVECDLTATSTRVFSGRLTGNLNENDSVVLVLDGSATDISGTVVATTSGPVAGILGQVLIDNISGTSSHIAVASGSVWRVDGTRYWTVQGTGDALGASPIAVAKIDGSWTASDTAAVTIFGWETDQDNYIRIYTTDEARHDGKWDYNKYRLYTLSSQWALRIRDPNVRVDGVQFFNQNSGSSYGGGINDDNDDRDSLQVFSNNIIIGQYAGLLNYGTAISAGGYNAQGARHIYNNIIYNFTLSGQSSRCVYVGGGTLFIYNNTCHNSDRGLMNGVATIYSYNNIFSSTTYPYDGTIIYSDYNAADGTDPEMTGANDKQSQYFAFVSTTTGAEDLRLQETDTGAKDAGFDITSSSTLNVIPGIEYDILGTERPWNGAWDIGAHEFKLAKIYRSVGPGKTTPLQCGGTSRNMSINSGTAFFNIQYPISNIIGVGDALVYNASSSIAFIDGRISSTTYSLQTAAGYPPADFASSTSWCIYRAYTSLANAESGQENSGIPAAVRNFDDWTAGGDATTDDVGRDLVTNNEQWNIACYGDAVDTTAVTIEDWTTGEDNYLKIYTPVTADEVGVTQRHSGKWDDDKYILNTSNRNIDNNIDYTWIDGLQITGGGSNIGFLSYNISYASNNIINDKWDGIYGNQASWNNIIYNCGGQGIRLSSRSAASYNNTIYGCQIGIYGGSGAPFVVNNIAYNNNDNYTISNTSNSRNNLSGPTQTDAPGSDPVNAATLRFWDAANHDYHLHPEDTAAINAGTSTPRDAIASLQHDIDGQPRPPAGEDGRNSWDIGADEASVYFNAVVKQAGTGGDHSSLSAWESANQVDLTATTTKVFSCSSFRGVIPNGSSVFGTTTGAVASTTVMSTTSLQILLHRIASSTFVYGEKVIVRGTDGTSNYCILGNAGDPAIAVAKIDGTWTGADTNAVEIDGWTTGERNYIRVYTTPEARHRGKWDEGKYRIEKADPSSGVIEIMNSYVYLEGLQAELKGSTGYRSGIWIYAPLPNRIISNVHVFGSIVRNGSSVNNQNGIAVYDYGGSYQNITVSNNIVYGYDSSGDACIRMIGTAESWIFNIINNTVYNCTLGYESSWGDARVYNNISQACNKGFDDTTAWGGGHNLSSDWTAPGTNSKTTTTVAFLDAANYDFHLHPDDTAARDAGTSTTAVGALRAMPLQYDIDGTARGGAYDIGADEVPVEFVSTICQTAASGGDCANLDYSTLSRWEDKVETNLSSSTTRVFSGWNTGILNENDSVTLVYPAFATTTVTGTVVATTSDQILIDNITGTTTPVVAIAGAKWRNSETKFFTVSATSTAGRDGLGASPIAVAKIDGSWTASDTQYVSINGWTTDNDNSIKIYTTDSARHQGRWDYGKYRMYILNTSAIYIYESYTWIDGIQINNDASGNVFPNTIVSYVNTMDSAVIMSNAILKANFEGLDNYGRGISNSFNQGANIYIRNNIVYDYYSSNPLSTAIRITTPSVGKVYNNTIFNSNAGIQSDLSVAVNNLISSTTNSFTGTFAYGTDYNATDINDTPGVGINNRVNQTFAFVSTTTGAEDFHLQETDTGAKDRGYNIAASSTLWIPAFAGMTNQAEDIDGQGRPTAGALAKDPGGTSWDIGADEVATAKIYRSVGPSKTTPLQCGGTSRNMSISSAISNFQFPISNNIGVGDVLVYNASSTIAFIDGRISSTTYSVQMANGYSPADFASTTSWCIYRAYTSLSDAEGGDENAGIPLAVRDFDTWDGDGGRDLVTNNEQWNIACYGDAVDTSAVTIQDWTTGEDNYLKVYTPVTADEVGVTQRHSGKWDEDKYQIIVNTLNKAIYVRQNYTKIFGLQINRASDSTGYGFSLDARAVSAEMAYNIVKLTGNHSSGGAAIYTQNGSSNKIYNNIVFDSTKSGIWDANTIIKSYVYNNTVAHVNGYGFSQVSGGRNNIAYGSGVNDYYLCSLGSNNISSDATAPGASSKINTTVRFWDPDNHDYHLHPEDTAAINAGTSTVTSDELRVTSDIDGQPRPPTGVNGTNSWDIGADEASVYFNAVVKQAGTGGDHSSLSAWEAANQADLTATTTKVFSCSSFNGAIPNGASVIGTTSGAVASSTVMSTSSLQILLHRIASSTFVYGEKVIVRGTNGNTNYCILGNAGDPAIAVAKIDGTWTSHDPNQVTIDGWTTNKYNFIKVYTTGLARHEGQWSDTKYRLTMEGWETYALEMKESYVWIDGLQLANHQSGQYSFLYSNIGSMDSMISISNNIIKGPRTWFGIEMGQNNSLIWNNIVYGDFGAAAIMVNDWGSDFHYIYNNSVNTPAMYGIYSYGAANVIATNNIVSGTASADFYGSFYTGSSHNISEDATAPGANSKTNATVQFVDAANGDFHLATEDTAARDAGTSTTWIPAFAGMTNSGAYDIDGQERYDARWDIGADEAATILYRSVGNDTNNLNRGNATVTITATSSARFSSGLADNIGVGDVIQYGTPLQLAFISGRISSTTYLVQARTGAAATATTSATAAIYRTFEHLNAVTNNETWNVNPGIHGSVDDYVIIPNDLRASNTALFIPCYASTSIANLTSGVSWETSTTSIVKIYTPVELRDVGISQRHSGIWTTEKFISYNRLYLYTGFVIIEGLQLRSDNCILDSTDLYSNYIIRENIISGLGADYRHGIYIGWVGSGNAVIENNIIYNFNGLGSNCVGATGGTYNINNNTLFNCTVGFNFANNVYAKNNIVASTTDDFNGSFALLDHNASDDLDGTNAVDISPARFATEEAGWDAAFRDWRNGDFRPRDTASVLYNSGTTLVTVTDDIMGTARPQNGTYDIGAFELIPSGGVLKLKGGTMKMQGTIKFK